MSNVELLKQKINEIKPKPAVFRLSARWRQEINFSSSSRPDYSDDSVFFTKVISSNICENFSATSKRFEINRSDTFEKSVRECYNIVRDSFYKVCPAKRPRQTKFFKTFSDFMYRYKTDNPQVSETIVSLAKYYIENQDNMQSDLIQGKTYYGLLQALVKKYGKY